MKTLMSLQPVRIHEWAFKVSVIEGNILIVAFNLVNNYTKIRFFDGEDPAKEWVKSLSMNNRDGVKND